MKRLIVILLCLSSILWAESVDTILKKSDDAANSGDLEAATEILKAGIEEHTDSADLYAQYGLYLSQQAGNASFLKAGMLSDKSFKILDKALEIDPEHRNAILYRGILAVNVPKFMGKLNQGIEDLEHIQAKYGSIQQLYLVSSYYLGIGYQKKGDEKKASEHFKFIMLYGKESEYYNDAKEQYNTINKVEASQSDVEHFELGNRYLEDDDLYNAVKEFRLATAQNPENIEFHLILARTLGLLAEQGYDESIKEDVTLRAEIANEVFEVLSRCVELAPGDEEILFLRGSVAVNLPFFVNSLDTGINDLKYLSDNADSDEMRSEAGFLLKHALETQKVYSLAEQGYEAESDEEKAQLLQQFIQTKSPINQDKPEGDFLQVDLTLGYRDQIQPQTAVWIEDIDGNYLATLYISGFAAFVKENQMHLPRWGRSSQFQGIDSVTGASIDCGEHRFYWDLKDCKNYRFKGEKVIVKTEICHWPHVQYTLQELPVDLLESGEIRSSGDKYLLPEIKATLVIH